MRDFAVNWLNNHQSLGINKILYAVLDWCDGVVVNTKNIADKITLAIAGQNAQNEVFDIQTREVSLEEALQQFPGFKEYAVLVEEI